MTESEVDERISDLESQLSWRIKHAGKRGWAIREYALVPKRLSADGHFRNQAPPR
jgi:hypothetical protein